MIDRIRRQLELIADTFENESNLYITYNYVHDFFGVSINGIFNTEEYSWLLHTTQWPTPEALLNAIEAQRIQQFH